jgi:transposase
MKISRSEQILQDHEISGLSIRSLGRKYGMSPTTIYRMISKERAGKNSPKKQQGQTGELKELPDDVAMLKAMLRKEQLKNELLNNVIDIASKELGVDIRKKPGTRQSE